MLFATAAIPAFAQEDTDPTDDVDIVLPGAVTLDDVNRVAERMYCPECENIPLDKCGTVVCIQWKREIASQLEQGRTDDEIINDFATRFGDYVIGIPQDPFFRNLSFIAPIAIAVLALMAGMWVFFTNRNVDSVQATLVNHNEADSDDYRSRLETDLNGS